MTWTDEQIAAAAHYAHKMERPWCMTLEPYDELEMLIGTPNICFECRKKEKQRRLDELLERSRWPLGLA